MLSREEMWCISAEEVIELSRSLIRNYEVNLLRWLAAKRDYPWANEPEPADLPVIVWLYRDRIIKDFNRSLA